MSRSEFKFSGYRHGCDPPNLIRWILFQATSSIPASSCRAKAISFPRIKCGENNSVALQWGEGLCLISLALMLAACSGGGSDSTSSAPSPTSTVAGIDSNSNGVRDDVEQYINTTYGDPSQNDTKNALMQYAKALQVSIVDATSPNATANVAGNHLQQTVNAFQCLAARRPDDFAILTSELRVIALDTDERRQAFLRSEQLAEPAVNQLDFSNSENWTNRCSPL